MQVQYDPALYLGCIVKKDHLDYVEQVSKLHAQIDHKKDKVNMLKKVKEEFEILKFEIDFDKMERREDPVERIIERIKEAQEEYLEEAIKNYDEIFKLTKPMVSSSVESPIDWTKSKLRSDLPISADTMKCDVRWFNVDNRAGGSEKQSEDVGAHIKASLSAFGASIGADASYDSKKDQQSLNSSKNVCSTLVLTCMCTHKNARTFAPCVFDLKKLVRAWNEMFPKDAISDQDVTKKGKTRKTENKMHMVAGASYSSAMVGTVTFKDESKKESNLDTEKTEMKGDLKIGVAGVPEGMGPKLDVGGHNNTSKEVMNMLSNQTISVHFNLYCAGLIPNLEKQMLKTSVKMLSSFETKDTSGNIGEKIGEILKGLGDRETSEAAVLNSTTMMNAFDNYINMSSSGDEAVGVPTNYFLKPITKSYIIELLKEGKVRLKKKDDRQADSGFYDDEDEVKTVEQGPVQ